MPPNAPRKRGHPTKEQQDETRKILFETWFGHGYPESYIAKETGYDRETISRYHGEWFKELEEKDRPAFIELQHQQKEKLVNTVEDHITRLFEFLKKLEGMRVSKKTGKTLATKIPLEFAITSISEKIVIARAHLTEVLMKPTIEEKIAEQVRVLVQRKSEEAKALVDKHSV